MRFPGFRGNESLKARLSAGQLSHCYILEGPAGSGKKTLATLLAAAMECEGGGNSPCCDCGPCRKVRKGEHPDVITVDSDKATVPISLIREMQSDAYIRPNEGRRKVYIIPRAGDMQGSAQNALLKLLEEPPAYCAFLLLTDSGEKLLETVRSRAVSLTLSPLSDRELLEALQEQNPEAPREDLLRALDRSGGYLGAALAALGTPDTEAEKQAAALAAALKLGDELQLLQALFPLEKLGKQELLPLLSRLEQLLLRAIGEPGAGTAMLYQAAQAVREAAVMVQSNVGGGQIAGFLMAQLRP